MTAYTVGIDLGTTHTVVAYAPAQGRGAGKAIRLFEIEQLVAPGEVAARPLLPSFRYHPAPGELATGDVALPWAPAGGGDAAVIGSLARQLGAQVPGRLVASAKSWLSHTAVDRLAAILPWGAAADVPKVSPVAASASYLAHLRAAWNHRFPAALLEHQELVLTVPASFDDAARALTLEAARDAGLPTLRLLEEPQAALYDWLFRHRKSLAEELAATRLVLVCDVGGGTTDLSLVRVEMHGAEPRLERIAVGRHLMLGGDNMDLALAHLAESKLDAAVAETGGAAPRLSAGQLSQLVERCRATKERLLAADAPASAAVTLLGAGSRLVGGARSVELGRDEVERSVVDGFFPLVAAGELPRREHASGLVAFGLPYANDPAVTRHIAAFLQQQTAAGWPDALLLNGGVFRADAIAARLHTTLATWRGAPLRSLHNADPDVAVARGAVAYALARRGLAPKIGGGSPRSYFLLLDGAGAAAAGGATSRAQRGVCVLPHGSEEGREIRLEGRSFVLRVGEPVRFHLVSTTAGGGGTPLPGAPSAGAGPLPSRLSTRSAGGSGTPLPGAPSAGAGPLPSRLSTRSAGGSGTPLPGAPSAGAGPLPSRLSTRSAGGSGTPPPGAPSAGPGPLPSRLSTRSAGGGGTPPPGVPTDQPVPLAGELVDLADRDVQPLPPVATVVRAGDASAGRTARRDIPVQLATMLTELGTLEVHCIAADDPTQRWKLEFQLRADPSAAAPEWAALPPRFGEAVESIDRVFGPRNREVGPKAVKQLRTQLEALLGSRERWPTALLRPLFDALWQRARGRRRSADHERLWLSLAGWCLRPGFGDALDRWRIEQLWPIFEQGVQHGHDAQVNAEWWTLWRRVAGGLDEAAQQRLLDDFAINLRGDEAGIRQRPPRLVKGSWDDMVRLGASLERIPVDHKVEIGDWLVERLRQPAAATKRQVTDSWTLWAIGRIGARAPLYGSAHGVVPTETAAAWLDALLAVDWKHVEGAAAAAANLVRLSGDRARDLPLETRERVIVRLEAIDAPPSWIARVRDAVPLDEAGERGVFGEALPPGLRLIG